MKFFVVFLLCSIVAKLNESGARQKEQIDEVKYYLREKKCGEALRKDILAYFNYCLSRKSMFNEQQIISELSEVYTIQ